MLFKTFCLFLAVFCFVWLLEPRPIIPVRDARASDWNANSFWHENWGSSGTHKGIDIFAERGTAVLSTVPGWVIQSGELSLGGRSVKILSPGWRIHYYAHFDRIQVARFSFVGRGEPIGTVGNTGNAHRSAPHLHYSIYQLLPDLRLWDEAANDWRRLFYIDPSRYLTATPIGEN